LASHRNGGGPEFGGVYAFLALCLQVRRIGGVLIDKDRVSVGIDQHQTGWTGGEFKSDSAPRHSEAGYSERSRARARADAKRL